MTNNIEGFIQVCLRDLKEHGDPDRAREQKRYLKSPFEFYGVRKPLLNAWAKKIKKSNPDITQEQLIQICRDLWNSNYHDQKTLAIELLKAYPKFIDDNELSLINIMIDESKGWDLIDNIAIWLVGRMIQKEPQKHELIKKWSKDPNFWRRRVAIISPIKLFKKKECDLDLFLRIWEEHLYEKEFFIRKAIGWVLRELAKSEPDLVFDFLLKNKEKMSGLTLREGSRNLSVKQKALLSNRKS